MLMPKAAMDENHLAPAAENQIRLSRKISLMEAIPIAKPMNQFSHKHFGLHALTLYTTHVF
jgi:hypothetical protein